MESHVKRDTAFLERHLSDDYISTFPDGSVLVSERDTALVKRIPAGGGAVETVGTVEGVDPGGEGGLLGLAVDGATFASTPVLYAYFTAGSDNPDCVN